MEESYGKNVSVDILTEGMEIHLGCLRLRKETPLCWVKYTGC